MKSFLPEELHIPNNKLFLHRIVCVNAIRGVNPNADRVLIKKCHVRLEHAEHHLVAWGHQLGLWIEASDHELGEYLQNFYPRSLMHLPMIKLP